jgi:hypothetical protein
MIKTIKNTEHISYKRYQYIGMFCIVSLLLCSCDPYKTGNNKMDDYECHFSKYFEDRGFKNIKPEFNQFLFSRDSLNDTIKIVDFKKQIDFDSIVLIPCKVPSSVIGSYCQYKKIPLWYPSYKKNCILFKKQGKGVGYYFCSRDTLKIELNRFKLEYSISDSNLIVLRSNFNTKFEIGN